MARPWCRPDGYSDDGGVAYCIAAAAAFSGGYFDGSDNVEGLLASVVEGVADAVGVTRVGFSRKCGRAIAIACARVLRCLPETNEIEYQTSVIRWCGGLNYMATLFLALTSPTSFRKISGHFCVVLSILLARRSLFHFTRGAKSIGWLFFGPSRHWSAVRV